LSHGSQPLQDEEGNITISFNGEIFNARQLRKELTESGVNFESDHSDTEVVLKGYIKYGIKFISQLNGMFAILILDRLNRKLFGVRDRFGIKPFHYFEDSSFLVCSSELDPLLHCMKSAGQPISLDFGSLTEYLQVGFISAPRTIFKKVMVLEPGHFIEFDLQTKESKQEKWWKLNQGSWGEVSRQDLPQLIRSEFIDAVKRWTYSDHPIALSLSGGLDSTCLLIAAEISGIKLDTFSLVFEDSAFKDWDESENIDRIVANFKSNHSSISLSVDDFQESLPDIIKSLGQPYGGGLPTFKIFQEVSKSHRVCLTGTGGDELFGNYGRHRLIENKNIQTQENLDEQYTRIIYKSRLPLLERIFPSLDFSQQINNWFSYFQSQNETNFEDRVAFVDINTQLPDEFLLVTDRLSMMYSVEARTPFLDHIFVENVLSIPSQLRHSLPYKQLLRSAFKVELDKLNLSETKKGFSIPLSVWLRNELKAWGDSAINNPKLNSLLDLDSEALWGIYVDFLDGNNENILMLWKIMMFSAWLNQSDYV
jgi:asparagine synthase (glutamine-hydrolysing)